VVTMPCPWCASPPGQCADDCPTSFVYVGDLPPIPARCWWCESMLPHVWHDNGVINEGRVHEDVPPLP
jgi:hypothetical protein